MLSLLTWVLLPLRRQTQMRTREPWTLKNSQCFTRWCPCVEISTCCSWATVTRRIISLWRSWLSSSGWNRRYGNVCIHVWGHELAFKCKERILQKISTWDRGQSTDVTDTGVWNDSRKSLSCFGWFLKWFLKDSGPFPCPALGDSPECSQCQQHPWAGEHCPKSWSCSQLPSALTQTAFCFCCCLDAWKSVDSLFCSICYSFGKMWNILQPEDRTKEGWGFC